MIKTKMDTRELMSILNNSVKYGQGFLDGIQMQRLEFNRVLGGYTAEALNKYLDARARVGGQLHHVYEPGRAGDSGARLFKFQVRAGVNNISFNGTFVPSSGIPTNGGEPLVDRANIMENDIAVTIVPRQGGVLAFEDNGETVFTTESITIEHPGGDGVAGSFGEAVDEFFSVYFKTALLIPLMKQLESAKEFERSFPAGTKGGRGVGVAAGRRYFNLSGVTIE